MDLFSFHFLVICSFRVFMHTRNAVTLPFYFVHVQIVIFVQNLRHRDYRDPDELSVARSALLLSSSQDNALILVYLTGPDSYPTTTKSVKVHTGEYR